MADENDNSLERFEELQVAKILFGLSPEEELELKKLELIVSVIPNHITEIVGDIDLLCSRGASMHLPDRLRSKIASDAMIHLSDNQNKGRPSGKSKSTSRQSLLPWSIALAASLLLVASLVGRWLSQDGTSIADPSEQRAKLLASAKDVIVLNWNQGTTPVPNASGDVVWSAAEQQGYMRFANLPVNDPLKEQYQLWVFDRNQDQKTPVDGGVFNIVDTKETIVAFRPKLVSNNVYLFAITIEKPGGVVVSDRSRLPLLANVP